MSHLLKPNFLEHKDQRRAKHFQKYETSVNHPLRGKRMKTLI